MGNSRNNFVLATDSSRSVILHRIPAIGTRRVRRHLATASDDHTVRLWNVSSPAAEPLALHSPDSSTQIHMWDLRLGELPAVPRLLGDEVGLGAGSVFSPDGQWLAIISTPIRAGVDSVDLGWPQGMKIKSPVSGV